MLRFNVGDNTLVMFLSPVTDFMILRELTSSWRAKKTVSYLTRHEWHIFLGKRNPLWPPRSQISYLPPSDLKLGLLPPTQALKEVG